MARDKRDGLRYSGGRRNSSRNRRFLIHSHADCRSTVEGFQGRKEKPVLVGRLLGAPAGSNKPSIPGKRTVTLGLGNGAVNGRRAKVRPALRRNSGIGRIALPVWAMKGAQMLQGQGLMGRIETAIAQSADHPDPSRSTDWRKRLATARAENRGAMEGLLAGG